MSESDDSRPTGYMHTDAALRDRLKAWEDEKETNRFGLAHLADQAIRLLRGYLGMEAEGDR